MSDQITGTTIADRYRITGFLRAGRMGDQYVARRLEDGSRVAVKLLDETLFDNPEAVKRFEREARITRSIDHPGSMVVLDMGRIARGPYLVTEYVEGELLSDAIAEQGSLEPVRAARIVGRIALALEAAHNAGIIHRDLASSNVLLATQGPHRDIVKVTDFGLSHLTRGKDDEEELTAVGVRIGVPSYMAPEYIEEFLLDHRADIYGLGVMLFEMLTGELPFVGSPFEVMEMHIHAERPRPSARVPGVPGWLDDLVIQMMEVDPDRRVQSAHEVITLIELALKESLDAPRYVASTAEPAPPRAPAVVRDEHAIEELVRQHLIGVERGSGAASSPSRQLVVARVARSSIASHIGVMPGWRLHLPDEDAGTGLLDPSLPAEVSERRYVFSPPGEGEALVVRTTGLDLGMQLLRSPENVAENFDPAHPDADALLDLWRQARWSMLHQLSLRAITGARDVSALLTSDGLAAYLQSDEPRNLDQPAVVLLGAALYEEGRRAEGLRWTRRFTKRHAADWPDGAMRDVYSAIADLYEGLEQMQTGHRDKAISSFERAARTGRLSRGVARTQELTRAPLDLAPMEGRRMSDLALGQRISDGANVQLAALLDGLHAPQLLTLCVLGTVRGNLEYDAFVHRYVRFARHLGDRFSRLVVVTPTRDRDAAHPEHYRGEEGALALGVDLQIVHDDTASVSQALEPSTSPSCYVITAEGVCVHEGAFTSCDAWDALSMAGSA